MKKFIALNVKMNLITFENYSFSMWVVIGGILLFVTSFCIAGVLIGMQQTGGISRPWK